MVDLEMVEEFKARIADRYTAAELCELLEIPVEDIIETYIELLIERKDALY